MNIGRAIYIIGNIVAREQVFHEINSYSNCLWTSRLSHTKEWLRWNGRSPTFQNYNSIWNCLALYHEPLARVITQALPVFDIKFAFTFLFYIYESGWLFQDLFAVRFQECYSAKNSNRATQRFSTNHKRSSEQKNRNSLIFGPITNEKLKAKRCLFRSTKRQLNIY